MYKIKLLPTYGSLSIIGEPYRRKPTSFSPDKQTFVLAKCICGIEKDYQLAHLKDGRTVSCGCHKREAIGKRRYKHGKSNTRLYTIWLNLIDRCYRKKNRRFIDYGGRGITVCDEWRTAFKAFNDWAMANGYEDNLQIDRTNNNGNYDPSNCRWVRSVVNVRNRRCNKLNMARAICIRILRKRRIKTIRELAKIYSVCESTIDLVAANKIWYPLYLNEKIKEFNQKKAA